MRKIPAVSYVLAVLVATLGTGDASAQTFVRITDAANPVVSDPGPLNYSGASWVDYDGDGGLDLYVNQDMLYRNDGGGVFARVATAIGAGQGAAGGNGNSWADYDNDGDLDVFVASGTSVLYRNEGDGTFAAVTGGGDIDDTTGNRGWACAWADLDNDGDVDLVITHPCGFVPGACTTNHLLINDGPPFYTFTRQDTGAVVTGFAPYTVGSWSDYDLDGDQDLFIGSGPASATPAADRLYRNQLTETGVAFFQPITTSPIATELNDGQLWNWIDFDNDRDLDAHVTNWGGGGSVRQDRLYRNDNGVYSKITTGSIVTDASITLAGMWGDYDNDGDLDCYVTNDNNQLDRYYRNNGNSSFTAVSLPPTQEGITHRGGSAGDYDGDGDLDLFLAGPGTRRLYRNDTANGNQWIVIRCQGTASNRAGIGARVEVNAVVNGVPTWMMREISTQNSFNGHNMLPAHFGLGAATVVDSVRIHWPSGTVDTYTGIAVAHTYTAIEGQGFGVVGVEDGIPGGSPLVLHAATPNPFRDRTRISFRLARTEPVRVELFDTSGRRVARLLDQRLGPGVHTVPLAGEKLPAGVFYYRVATGDAVSSGRVLHLR